MKLIIVAVLIVVASLAIRHAFGQRRLDTDGGFVTIGDIPRLVEKLRTTGRDGSFWVVLIPATARGDGYAANLQASIEHGKLGIDWVLIAQRNIEDRGKFSELIEGLGLSTEQRRENGVDYLRIESPSNPASLCSNILTNIYGVTPTTKLQLIITGINWP
jgi:hypothetical protein